MYQVTNQPPPLEPLNLLRSDAVLREALVRENAQWAEEDLTALGALLGRPETIQLGFEANRNPPVLRSFDRYGHRLDEIDFHPAWHELMSIAMSAGLHSSPWADPKPGAHVARAIGTYLLVQVESGVYCPIAMTYASVPTLRRAPVVAQEWLPRIFARSYDQRFLPPSNKRSALIGMAMTENQGGSDLRTNTTRAEPDSGTNSQYFRLTGHKWFLSAPMCDAFLILAQSAGGLSCFLVPRWTPEGRHNTINILRLKDKLGNRSNASSEVEFVETHAQLVGEQGRGIPTIIEMSNYTRLDCVIGSAGLMRQAVAQAIHHASHRTAFNKRLLDHGLMANVLADLAIESEAATVLAMRLARAYDQDGDTPAIFRRVITPAAKFWICKRAPFLAQEAMEVLGGNGYVEECSLPRIYREMPLNSIWEGAGNMMCLDVLRAIGRMPNAPEILLQEVTAAASTDRRFKAFVTRLQQRLIAQDRDDETQARSLARDLILAVQGALLLQHSPASVADGFCASRLDNQAGGTFGSLPRGLDLDDIIKRAAPNLH
jgi:putative acyl-CoA dehydrogenase